MMLINNYTLLKLYYNYIYYFANVKRKNISQIWVNLVNIEQVELLKR